MWCTNPSKIRKCDFHKFRNLRLDPQLPRCYIGANRGGGNRFSKKPSFPGGFCSSGTNNKKNRWKLVAWVLGKPYPFSRVENWEILFFKESLPGPSNFLSNTTEKNKTRNFSVPCSPWRIPCFIFGQPASVDHFDWGVLISEKWHSSRVHIDYTPEN